jgi:serine/threonine protein kinase
MDLRSYGIQVTLQKGMRLEPHLKEQNIRVGYFSKHRGLIILPSGRYSLGAFLGSGSFATIYSAVHEKTNKAYTMKLISLKNVTMESVMRECIVHILLMKESVNEKHGPYVPRFYEVVHDSYNNMMILRTEIIQDILYDRYRAGTPQENDTIVPNTLAQMAQILDFFYRRLRFNHRDCKPNNVLYNYDPVTGRIQVKLIDFGYSCLCWNEIDIHAGDRISGTCFRPSRDLTQFLYATYTDRAIPLSEGLKAVFREMLTFPVDGTLCRLHEGCHAYGHVMELWAHTYRFMNDRRIDNPHAIPKRVRARMLEFMGKPVQVDVPQKSIVGLPHCTPERVLNPKTRRCVTRVSSEGRRILRLSKRYSTPSPKTMRQYRNSKASTRKGSRAYDALV